MDSVKGSYSLIYDPFERDCLPTKPQSSSSETEEVVSIEDPLKRKPSPTRGPRHTHTKRGNIKPDSPDLAGCAKIQLKG